MPTCPNCGSYIPLGNHSCSCGTTVRDDFEEEEGGGDYRSPDENPYDYDFLNELYHDYFRILPLEKMNEGIAEFEEKYSAEFQNCEYYSCEVFYLSFSVEAKYYDAIIRASYDSSYAYNDIELISDIVTPDLSKLYSSEEFKDLVRKTESEIGSKFMHCSLGFIGDKLIISVFFEGLNTFFLNGNDLVFRE